MCGIIGIVGSSPVSSRLVDSLRRLEYRGYDSAGVAVAANGRLERRRAEGKLRNLETLLAVRRMRVLTAAAARTHACIVAAARVSAATGRAITPEMVTHLTKPW